MSDRSNFKFHAGASYPQHQYRNVFDNMSNRQASFHFIAQALSLTHTENIRVEDFQSQACASESEIWFSQDTTMTVESLPNCDFDTHSQVNLSKLQEKHTKNMISESEFSELQESGSVTYPLQLEYTFLAEVTGPESLNHISKAESEHTDLRGGGTGEECLRLDYQTSFETSHQLTTFDEVPSDDRSSVITWSGDYDICSGFAKELNPQIHEGSILQDFLVDNDNVLDHACALIESYDESKQQCDGVSEISRKRAKLSAKDARLIFGMKNLRGKEGNSALLATYFGITRKAVHDIWRGRTWKAVTSHPPAHDHWIQSGGIWFGLQPQK